MGVRKGSKPLGPRPPVTPSRPKGLTELAAFINANFPELKESGEGWPVKPADAARVATILLEQLAIWKA